MDNNLSINEQLSDLEEMNNADMDTSIYNPVSAVMLWWSSIRETMSDRLTRLELVSFDAFLSFLAA